MLQEPSEGQTMGGRGAVMSLRRDAAAKEIQTREESSQTNMPPLLSTHAQSSCWSPHWPNTRS